MTLSIVLAHIKRGDLWAHTVYIGLVLLYWFDPLIWLLRRPLQHLRELCCDATVGCHLREQSVAYRETLRMKARDVLSCPVDPGLGLLGLLEDTHLLKTRMQWLKREPWRNASVRRVFTGFMVLVMACCIMPMAPLTLVKE